VTAQFVDGVWSLPTNIFARLERGFSHESKTPAVVAETVALRRCAMYRSGFKGTAVSFPAELMRFDAVAAWLRRTGVTVDVSSSEELDEALSGGIKPTSIVSHPPDRSAAPIRHAINAGVGRFVVRSGFQIGLLASCADRVQAVVIDTTAGDADSLVEEVLAYRQLDLVGLHCRLVESDDVMGSANLREMVAAMARTRRERGKLLFRVSLAGVDVGAGCLEPRILRRVAEAMGEVIGDACTVHRMPRPSLTLSPDAAALLP
jgi:pyridoxal-dependent decarboxylase-like protein